MNDRRPHRTMTINPPESLDERIVPSGLGVTRSSVAAQEAIVSAMGGPTLGSIYREYISYEQSGGHGAFKPGESGQVFFKGTSVEVDLHLSGGNFNNLVKQLRGEGLSVTSTSAKTGDVRGYLPISKLPTIATSSHETSLSSITKPGSVAASTTFSAALSSPVAAISTAPAISLAVASPSATSASVLAVSEKGGPVLGAIYQEYLAYEQAGGQGAFDPSQSGQIAFSGSSVGVAVRVSGDLNTAVGQLQGSGMLVTATSAQSDTVEGYLPIAQLPTVAGNSQVIDLSPIFRPIFRGAAAS